ncbi:hypothetical protein HDU76_005931, partial [Blyttiomyces sp. JEL0837]
QRRSSSQIPIQKITLQSEVSKLGRAAIASSRNRQLVQPKVNSQTKTGNQPFHSSLFQNIDTRTPNKISVNLSDPQYGLDTLPGVKLFFTKVPVAIGQSGVFSLVLANVLYFNVVRGSACTIGPSCEGPKLKSTDPEITPNGNTIGFILGYQFGFSDGFDTTAFSIGGVHPQTTLAFYAYNFAENITTDAFGDGYFSLTNNADLIDPHKKGFSWLMATYPPGQQMAGLYLPFVDRPNDHGELTFGGF